MRAVQIDFDATVSQRAFYRNVMGLVRRHLPPRYPLTMTALVSWCAYDHWIDSVDVDAAVPMYFRMGPERALRAVTLRSDLCKDDVGLSLDELEKVQLRPHIFLFNPRPWTPEAFRTAVAQLHQW